MSIGLESIVNSQIEEYKKNDSDFDEGLISDGYHTFNELYEFRKIYNACLFNQWVEMYDLAMLECKEDPDYIMSEELSDRLYRKIANSVHKSWKHEDGTGCFGEKREWFIVSAMLPTGLISNHYKAEDWDLFNVREVEKALFEFDGHTGKDVLERLMKDSKSRF